MDSKRVFLCVLWFLGMFGLFLTVSCCAGEPDAVEYRDEVQYKSLPSQEDWEIIQNLDFLENLSFLSEDDFSLIEESDLVADQ